MRVERERERAMHVGWPSTTTYQRSQIVDKDYDHVWLHTTTTQIISFFGLQQRIWQP
jgi:hypothetical protein